MNSREAIFVYSSPFAVYVFNDAMCLLEQVPVKDPSSAIEILSAGGFLPEESLLFRKHSGKSIVVLGLRSGEGVSFSQDARKFHAVPSENLSSLRELVISFAKRQVSMSVGDDNLVVQAASAIAEIDKSVSLLVKRLREWYSFYGPEISQSLPVHEDFLSKIAELKPGPGMGGKFSKPDLDAVFSFSLLLKQLYTQRSALVSYLGTVMARHCPNLFAVAGSSGAELIVQAGSLQRLAMMPSSTIQILGAEKELFKHIKDKKQRPPKAGVIQGHPLVTSASRPRQARVAKLLADKISIAVRVDYFRGKFVGDQLLADLKARVEK